LLRLRTLQRGFGFDDRDLVVDAGFIERRGSDRALSVRFHGIVEDLLQLSWPRISKKKLRQASLLGETFVLEIRRITWAAYWFCRTVLRTFPQRSGAQDASSVRNKWCFAVAIWEPFAARIDGVVLRLPELREG